MGHDDHSHGGHGKLSISPKEIEKIVARAETQVFPETPKYVSSPSGGVDLVQLKGRFRNERPRLGPDFTEEDRQWRIKWHQSQEMHHSEPFYVPALQKVNLNPIRRLYRAPLDILENALAKRMVCF